MDSTLATKTEAAKLHGIPVEQRSRLCQHPSGSRANTVATNADSLPIPNVTNHLVGIVNLVSDRKWQSF